MKKIDYEKLTEITVKSQKELDMIPKDFRGQIYIEFGTWLDKAVVSKKYVSSVVARGNSSVVARENSSVEARENSSVVAWGNSSVEARENSSVEAWENSSVVARENSSVEAWENSSVVAWGNSSVEARGNTQIVDCLVQNNGRIKINGNARIVYNPKNIYEYLDFYGIKHDKKKATFFKAVRKHQDKIYCSNWDSQFIYKIGKIAKAKLDKDVNKQCGQGIHISHLAWAVDFGRDWDNLAILEVEVDIDSIVVPVFGNGKVRTDKVKVIREVPLEECGLLGKILSKRMELKS